MKKFNGILFCTDLDGTLYTSDKRVSRENLDAIEYFKSEGGIFTFITGRVPEASMVIYNTVKPNAPFGCLNGGGIYDAKEDKYLWHSVLPDSAADFAKEVEKALPEIGIQVVTEKKVYFHKDNYAMEIFRKITGIPFAERHLDDIERPILKMVFAHHEQEQMARLEEMLSEHPDAKNYDFVRSERILFEFLPKGVSKGNVLFKMAELFGTDALKTVAVGDYNNDVSMIKAAGLGFAV